MDVNLNAQNQRVRYDLLLGIYGIIREEFTHSNRKANLFSF